MVQKITIKEEVTVDPLWKGSCCCGQEVIIADDEQGTPVAFHSLPSCRNYENLNLLNYLKCLWTHSQTSS